MDIKMRPIIQQVMARENFLQFLKKVIEKIETKEYRCEDGEWAEEIRESYIIHTLSFTFTEDRKKYSGEERL